MSDLSAFENQKYLNLETFRKSGVGVRTPVWFVQDEDTLYVRTIADSGKVKRVRNRAEVNIAPCKVDGEPLSDFVPALAREVGGEEVERKVDHLLDRKYGLLKKMFSLMGRSNGRRYTIIELKRTE